MLAYLPTLRRLARAPRAKRNTEPLEDDRFWSVQVFAGRGEVMGQADGLTEAGLKTPRAAAIAGVVFRC